MKADLLFQFYDSTIKSELGLPAGKDAEARFNSTIVRLRAQI